MRSFEGAGVNASTGAAAGHPFAREGRPLVWAHRGASRQAPENTLAAFDLAARLGYAGDRTNVAFFYPPRPPKGGRGSG